MERTLFVVPFPTRHGVFVGGFTHHGLAQLRFPNPRSADTSQSHRLPASDSPGSLELWSTIIRAALESSLAGQSPQALPPFDWSGATDFQKRVWNRLLLIPPGQTRSYGQIAAEVGSPGASRAVGGACGANPIPVLVPCHRVLAAHGRLGGFSGGLDWKRRLLALERPALALEFDGQAPAHNWRSSFNSRGTAE